MGGLGGLAGAVGGFLPLFDFQAGQLDAQLNPFLAEFPVAPVLGQFLFDLENQVWMDVFGSAFHLRRVTQLIVRALFEFGIPVLAGEATWAHGPQLSQLTLDGGNAFLNPILISGNCHI